MSGRDDTEHVDDPKYPEDRRGSHLLGVEEQGAPLYYSAEANTVYTGKVESGELMREWADERLLDDGDGDGSLSEFLDSESGSWQSLSSYAKRHLPGFDADGEDDGREGADR